MQLRFRIFMGATALLYIGPLLAGLGGAGWASVIAFTAIFILWLIVMRPAQWPRRWSEWQSTPAVVQALTQALMQVLLVTLLFVLGRAIGGALASRPDWPGFLPLSLSFLSIPVCRLIWNPWQAAQIDQFVDRAIASVDRSVSKETDGQDRTDSAMAMLAALPANLPADQIVRHLDAMAASVGAAPLWQALQQIARNHPAADDLRNRLIALVIFATEGRWIEDLGNGMPTRALELLPDDPAMLALFAERGLDALTEKPGLWGEFPNRERLGQRLNRLTGSAAEPALHALIAGYDRIELADTATDSAS